MNLGEEKGVVFTGLGVNRYADIYEKTGENTFKLVGDMLDELIIAYNKNIRFASPFYIRP